MEDSFGSLLKGTDTTKNFIKKLLLVVQQYAKILSDLQGVYSQQGIFSKWNDNLLYDIFVQIIQIRESYEVGFLKKLEQYNVF